MLAGWTAAVAVLGMVFGAISPSFDAFDSQGIKDLLERLGGTGGFRDILIGAVVSVMSLVVTCFAIAVVGHAGSDEHDGRAEQVLSTATSRTRAFLATITVALAGATWLLVVAGVTLALGVGNDTAHSSARLVVSAVAQAPAMWVVVALGVLCYAVRSSWASLGWGILVLFATLGQIGELLDLPQWVLDLSPYTHAPRMPLDDFELVPELALTAIAAVLLLASWLRYGSRDIG
jgi:ABC-2 type transport system permease protein